MSRFEDRIVLITGAASGIGKASAKRIASEGGTVVCVDLRQDAAQIVADEIVAAGGQAIAYGCDVSDQASVKEVVAATIARYGQLNALCNIAGVLRFDHSHEVSMEDFDRVMKVNAYGTFMMCQEAIPHLLKTRGFIVNTSSTAALGAHAWTVAYSASKGAVHSLTKCLAIEYGTQGLNCNAICPGGIDTPMVAASRIPEGADLRLLQKVKLPDGYFAPAEDVASVVAFFACEDCNHVKGDYLRVDGGMMT